MVKKKLLVKATIHLRKDPYNLTPNNNKRELIYINNKLFATKNKYINE